MTKVYGRNDFLLIKNKEILVFDCCVDELYIDGWYTITSFQEDACVASHEDDYPEQSYRGPVVYVEKEDWWIPFTSDYVDITKYLSPQLEFAF